MGAMGLGRSTNMAALLTLGTEMVSSFEMEVAFPFGFVLTFGREMALSSGAGVVLVLEDEAST